MSDPRKPHGCQCGWRGMVVKDMSCPICDGRRLFPVQEGRGSGIYPNLYGAKRPFPQDGVCGRCRTQLSGRRTAWCSDRCSQTWLIETGDPRAIRRALFQRDRGVCIDCGLDCGVLDEVPTPKNIADLLPRLVVAMQRVDRQSSDVLALIDPAGITASMRTVDARRAGLRRASFPGKFERTRGRRGQPSVSIWVPQTTWVYQSMSGGIRFTVDRIPLLRPEEVLAGQVTLCRRCSGKKRHRSETCLERGNCGMACTCFP